MSFFDSMMEEAGKKTGKAITNKMFGSAADDMKISVNEGSSKAMAEANAKIAEEERVERERIRREEKMSSLRDFVNNLENNSEGLSILFAKYHQYQGDDREQEIFFNTIKGFQLPYENQLELVKCIKFLLVQKDTLPAPKSGIAGFFQKLGQSRKLDEPITKLLQISVKYLKVYYAEEQANLIQVVEATLRKSNR